MVQDCDEYSTDLMKCIREVEREEQDVQVRGRLLRTRSFSSSQVSSATDRRSFRAYRSDDTYPLPPAQASHNAVREFCLERRELGMGLG